MIFTLLLGFSALFVASCAAYFSVLGIATLFSGSFLQVVVMASSLELGKLVATSYLYRFWSKTTALLKVYLTLAIFILMCITSIGIFGYLMAAYQVNSSKFIQNTAQVEMIKQQKLLLDQEVTQNTKRMATLNEARASQEKRLPSMSKQAAAPIYADMERSANEIKSLTQRNQELLAEQHNKDKEIITIESETRKNKDIGTFKFVADAIGQPLDFVVLIFVCILICVFDPLALSLLLAFNIASMGKITKEVTLDNDSLQLSKETTDVDEAATENLTKSSGFRASARVKNKRI
jgi:hypothetical protein